MIFSPLQAHASKVPHCLIVSSSNCLIASLSHCQIAKLPHYLIVSSPHLTIIAEFVPPKPKELDRKARIGCWVVWVMIWSFCESSSRASILMFGAIKSFCIIRIEYTSSLAPAIQHSCPVMDLVELTGVWLPKSW